MLKRRANAYNSSGSVV